MCLIILISHLTPLQMAEMKKLNKPIALLIAKIARKQKQLCTADDFDSFHPDYDTKATAR